MFNPCFCISLQKGVTIIAYLSLFFSIALVAEEVALIAIEGCAGISDIEKLNPEFGNLYGDHYENPDYYEVETTLPPGINGSSSQPGNKTVVRIRKLKNVTTTTTTTVSPMNVNFQKKTSFCSMRVSEVVISGVWFLSWFVDIGIAILLIYGARMKSIKLCNIWFYFRCATVIFKIIFLIIYFIAGLPILWKIPVILLCLFRVYSLIVVSQYINELMIEKKAKQKPRVASAMQDTERLGNQQHNIPGTPLW